MGALHVNDQLKLVIFLFGQLAVGVVDRLAENHRLSLRRQGGFKNHQILEFEALAQRRDVVHNG